MFQFVAGRLLSAALPAAALLCCPVAVSAQQPPSPAPASQQPPSEPGVPDPSAPLAPMPDIGVPWPDLQQTDTAKPIATAPTAGVADAATERHYSVEITGLDATNEGAIRSQFQQLSTLEQGHKEAANAAQIDRRAREDAGLLADLLRSRGYYDAQVETNVAAAPTGGDVKVTLAAEPGALYHFAAVDLPGVDQAGPEAQRLRDAFAVHPNDPVDADKVDQAQQALQVALGRRGFAFADLGKLDIAVDHATHTASLTLPVNPNGARRFGRIIVEGRTLFSARHIQQIARFHPGDAYRADLIEDLRRALVATGLVSAVTIRTVEGQAPKTVDVAISLAKAPVHTIAGEAGYGTGEGARLQLSWQHRNLIKPEGAVTFQGVLGTQEQSLSAILRMNDFLRRDQVLNAQISASHVDRPAYAAKTFQMAASLERQTNIIWQKKWTWSLGGELVATDERDVDLKTLTTRTRTFFIMAAPATLAYDGSNDLLDPTRGYRLSAHFSPELSLHNVVFGYSRLQLDGSFYQKLTDRITLAGRTRLGTIFGASRDMIAPSRRFYAGGGGSVRGFGYQELGPKDPVFNDPIGGRGLAEFAIEARIRFGNWGIVPFLDAGNISTTPLPRVDQLRFGTGLGVRYHTRFGPIRVDVGTPIARKPGESRIAVYVGLGQAF
ncbi:MAG TPA: BamA/TamA family outer membrane protein [Allosphingosinicella sp.]|jgi:translocation and assembly module TamA|nr:BamA/TamA family outer membrane protein [Allosphingosinicella sp.]